MTNGELAWQDLDFGKEFVFSDDGGDGHFSVGETFTNAHDAALAVDVDAVIGGDLGGESEGKFEIGTGGRRGVEVEADAAGADVETVGLGCVLRLAVFGAIPLGKADGEG